MQISGLMAMLETAGGLVECRQRELLHLGGTVQLALRPDHRSGPHGQAKR